MANDRIRLKCRKCGEERTFLKYYPEKFRKNSIGSFIPFPETLEAWLVTHVNEQVECRDIMPTLYGNRCFDLVTESKGDPGDALEFANDC